MLRTVVDRVESISITLRKGRLIEDITWPREDMKFLFECRKIFHPFAALTRETFFNMRKEILYLQVAM